MVGFLPRTHGSALFTRGETQAICTTTLGTKDSEQMIDGLEGLSYSRFMLHYNFPPYSVGEVGPLRRPVASRNRPRQARLARAAPGAAEQGRVPLHDPRPLRHHRVQRLVVDGDGVRRVPRDDGRRRADQAPVSGIAMGLILEGKDFAVISDILGDEDHLGDMDFKVAGTSKGITSLQMDIKVAGITEEIMKTALAQAKDGRAHILGEMAKALDPTREELAAHAPRIETMQIAKDKIREVIGTGGKVIREIVATTGAKVDIDDEGLDNKRK